MSWCYESGSFAKCSSLGGDFHALPLFLLPYEFFLFGFPVTDEIENMPINPPIS